MTTYRAPSGLSFLFLFNTSDAVFIRHLGYKHRTGVRKLSMYLYPSFVLTTSVDGKVT